MFAQKDPMTSLPDSWLSLTSSPLQNPLIFYQQLYYYALHNQLTSSIASLDNINDCPPAQTISSKKFPERQTIVQNEEEIAVQECKQKPAVVEPKVVSKLSKSSNCFFLEKFSRFDKAMYEG